MCIARISSSAITGQITPPPSKSVAHRALIGAALSGGGTICGFMLSADMHATLDAISSLGIQSDISGDTVTLTRGEYPSEQPVVDCGESGSTLRFLIPVFAALGIPATFIGHGRLPERPLGVYADCLPAHGVTLHSEDGLPLTLEGTLTGGLYTLPGDISSQFISGLLFALPLCGEDSDICLSSPLESAAYVELTLDVLRQSGISVSATGDGWHIPGNQQYSLHQYTVESDWSQAAFLLAAGALDGDITVMGLNPQSVQGDRAILSLLERFGADITVKDNRLYCRKAPLHGIKIDAAQIPDLVPILAIIAAAADGDTHIYNAGRLRLKESDRLAAMADCLRRLGADVKEMPDDLLIHGGQLLKGGSVCGYNDHRVVMSMAIAALICKQPIEVTDARSVNKSWPSFFEDFQRIGGNVHVIHDR
jgi:3-phosphoshikimate 1-carboxyvinyltransferase